MLLLLIGVANRNAPLADITPPDLVNRVYCPGIRQSGARAGAECERRVKDGTTHCTMHQKSKNKSLSI
jgi:hypothetical protein